MCENHVFSLFGQALGQNKRTRGLVWVSTPQRGKPVLFSVFRSLNHVAVRWPQARRRRTRATSDLEQRHAECDAERTLVLGSRAPSRRLKQRCAERGPLSLRYARRNGARLTTDLAHR